MNQNNIYIFLGPPFSGKETQTTPLSQRLGIPVFSMGHLIRQAKDNDQSIGQAFEEYTVKGLHVPIDIKFGLLKQEMDKHPDGFILDNFPASKEDLDVFNDYLSKTGHKVSKVFYLNIGHDEMVKRFNESPDRGRADDTVEALETRSNVQSQDRQPVLDYFSSQGLLIEINGEQPIEVVSSRIEESI